MRKLLIRFLLAAIGIAACPGFANAGLLSASGPVIALLGDKLFLGTAEGHLSGGGTLVIHSQVDPGLTCNGEFTSSAAAGGVGQLRCSNGAVASFSFERLTLRSGHGTGSVNQTPMNFTYGLTAEQSAPYLTLPTGKQFRHNGTELALADL